MNVPHEPTRCSPWPSQSPSEVRALAYELVQLHRSTVESLAQDIMVPRQVLPTAPIRRLNHVSVRFTLRPMPLHMPRDMAYLWQVANFTALIPPATRVLAYSSMQAFQPWFLLESIETTLV